MRRDTDDERGRRVREVLDARGIRSMRQADGITGVNHVTLGNMAAGRGVEMESVVKFARGFGLDIDDWLQLFGFERIRSPRDYFWTLFGAIVDECERLGRTPPPVPSFQGGSGSLTYEQADQIIAELRERYLGEA